ncbi:YheO-like PAS domain protein [Alkalibaculum sp. M08DMB]|uniref:YheO-like PAS domain protein n=2 Tax=Alkalibaculum sporogenes TaxID=2655001 RepID=A0A6A7K9Q5_9FIRM|nr:YheO-like PAS domain protein [Alkalibaculum sporogenes]
MGMVDFLADFLGEDAEVVLHDVADLENSVIAIRNNHISGREIGAPATDLVLKILKNPKYEEYSYLSNYKGVSRSGNTLKSATYLIKDENKVVGALCINMDIQGIYQIKTFFDRLFNFHGEEEKNEQISETFSQTANELTFDSIYKVVQGYGIPPERMDQDEKIKIVYELNEKGIFLIKGAVSEAALALKVSEATIYRYLGKLKKR